MDLHAGRDLLAQRREQRFHPVRHRNSVGSRLPLNRQNDGAVAVVPARYLVVLDVVEHLAELVEMNRSAVSVGDNHLSELLCVLELPVGLDRGGFVQTPQRSRRHADVLRANCGRDFIYADPAIGEGSGIELHAHGVFLAAIDLYLRDPRHHRDALRHERLAVLIKLRERHGLRGQRQIQDRLIGGIHLPI